MKFTKISKITHEKSEIELWEHHFTSEWYNIVKTNRITVENDADSHPGELLALIYDNS